MKFKKGNKKGELLSIWWILVLGMIGAGVVLAVSIYYSGEVDVNKIHSEILAKKLFDCFKDKENYDFNVYEGCNLKKEMFEKRNVYFNVSVFENKKIIFNVSKGNFAFRKDCLISLEEDIVAKEFPDCFKFVLNYNNKEIRILTGIKQAGGNVDSA